MLVMPARAAVLLLVLPLAVPALVGCADTPPAVSAPRPVLVSPNNPGVSTALPDRDTPQLVNVTLIGGQLTGDVGSVPVALDSQVRLTVVTDVSDTVVVDGFGQSLLTTVGQPVQLELVADRAGEFPVRLQQAGTVLTTLTVG
jgi:hypothetical protein